MRATNNDNNNARLNLQHYQWKDALGYLLHPSIPITKDQQNLKIADIETGTGYEPRTHCLFFCSGQIANTPEDPRIWLLDLARDLPASTQLDGFDISTAQYPAKEHLPPNVHLRILDILASDPPKDLQNQYDIVHIRLFIGVVCHGDPMPLLLNLVKLLRESLSYPAYRATTQLTAMPRHLQVQEATCNGTRPTSPAQSSPACMAPLYPT